MPRQTPTTTTITSANNYCNHRTMSNQPFRSPAPSLGLRQRHSSSANNAANNFGSVAPPPSGGDENSDPNNNGNVGNGGRGGGFNQSHNVTRARKIPVPPPRASLASAAGKINSRRIAAATTAATDRMMRGSNEKGGRGSSSNVVDAGGTRALVVPANYKNGNNENVDLSLWVVGYGESSRTISTFLLRPIFFCFYTLYDSFRIDTSNPHTRPSAIIRRPPRYARLSQRGTIPHPLPSTVELRINHRSSGRTILLRREEEERA